MPLSRRQFMHLAAAPAVISLGTASPRFLLQAAQSVHRSPSGKVLVMIQLSGGNDGLNSIIPLENDDYQNARPTLGIAANDVIRIDDDYGFHPALSGFGSLLEADRLGIVQGVGYPNPNRSHFESMDIWHTCQRKTDDRVDGWLGRSLAQLHRITPLDIPGVHIGQNKLPYALASRDLQVPSVRSLEQFQFHLERPEEIEPVRRAVKSTRSQTNPLLDFVQTSTATAIGVSERFRQSTKGYQPHQPYPETGLGEKLQTVAQLIDAELDTRVFYVELDGFDTHANQPDAHAGLLRQLGDALSTFIADITTHGHAERVLAVCFSEFGRRVKENASQGTDHGTAGPMFIAGEGVRSGLIGEHPSLSDLESGDLKFHTDFRQIYAALLEEWLGCDSEPILKGRFRSIPILSAMT